MFLKHANTRYGVYMIERYQVSVSFYRVWTLHTGQYRQHIRYASSILVN